jgi:hypothetical protein
MTIHEQIEAATNDVGLIEERLTAAGLADTARLARKTFDVLLPASIDSAAISPVHHSTVISRLLLDIAEGERLPAAEIRVLLLAILCHDAFLGVADSIIRRFMPVEGLPLKTRASDVRKAAGELRQQLVRRGVLERTLHNEEAARHVPAVLTAATVLSGVSIPPQEIEMIRSIVARHDLPAVAQLKQESGEPLGREDLFGPTERLALLFRAIDRLWMVTPEGIDVDVERDLAAGRPGAALDVLRRERGTSNAARHYEEYALYEKVYGDDVRQFGFIEKTLYTCETAFRIFRALSCS